MMKVQCDSARIDVNVRFTRQGSILANTIESGCEGLDVHLEVESKEPPERIAALLRNAEAGCYVMQTIKNPTPVSATYHLNGAPIEPGVPSKD